MGWLGELGKEILTNIISRLILLYMFVLLGPGFLFAPLIYESLGIPVNVWNILLLLLLITVTILIILRTFKVRQQVKKENRRLIQAGTIKPRHINEEIELERFGVKWRALVGSRFLGNFIDENFYVYIEGPFCPVCDYELDRKTKTRWLGLALMYVWRCAPCDKNYERPEEYPEERQIVKKYVESRLRKTT